MAPVTALPARYAKFITAALGETVAYIQLYGAAWHLEPALVMAGAALAVLGVPNGPASVTAFPAPPASGSSGRYGIPLAPIPPGASAPEPPSGTVTVRPAGGITP